MDRLSSAAMRFCQAMLMVAIGVNIYSGVKKNAFNDFKIIVEPLVYPSYAVQFMDANHIRGNIWVPFDWGEYLIWKLPDSKISIDGRFRTAYPLSVLDEHMAFLEGRPGWQTIPDKYPTDYILTRRKDKTHLLLNQHPGWLKIYEDPIAFLYVRVTEPPGRIETLSKQDKLITPSGPPSLDFP